MPADVETSWFEELTAQPVAVPSVALKVIAPEPEEPEEDNAIGVSNGPEAGATAMDCDKRLKVNVEGSDDAPR